MAKFRCALRKQLYEETLERVRTELEYYRDHGPALVRLAFEDKEFERLLDPLAELMDTFVVYGVQRDLKRLKACAVLRREVKNIDKPLPAEVTLDSLFYLDKEFGTYTGKGIATDEKVTPQDQYRRYFAWFINPKNLLQQENPMSGVQAFYERYPLLKHAVETAAAHYRDNITLACDRVKKDWADINKAFFPGKQMTDLVKIKSTGNDFHKGGKQVLILTFSCSDPSTGEKSAGRVVYKPSGVEIDCRIVGNSDIFKSVAPKGDQDALGYNQNQSLTEIINRYNKHELWPKSAGDPVKANLPTYVILPYNRGSVPDSYGYIEFLTHDPAVDASGRFNLIDEIGTAIQKLDHPTVIKSDWIITDDADGLTYCYQYGTLMGIAMALSLCDLHQQNVIAHNRQPHLIDLEEALKWPMEKITETYLDRGVSEYWDPVGKELRIDDDRSSNLNAIWRDAQEIPSTATLYHYRGAHEKATLVPILKDTVPAGINAYLKKMVKPPTAKFAAQRNCDALQRGLIDAFATLAESTCNQAAQQWVRNLTHTLARFVPLGTMTYLARFRELYQDYPDHSCKPDVSTEWRKFVRDKPPDLFLTWVGNSRKDWLTKLDRAAKGLIVKGLVQWVPPVFAVEHPEHAWKDYLNGDVPSFYHKLGDRELLNSRGEKVDVQTVTAWQNTNFSDLDDAVKDLPDTSQIKHFFPDTSIEMVCAQLQQLQQDCHTPEKMGDFVKKAVAGVLPVNSFFTHSLRSLIGSN